jgi:hypothetical protein
MVDDVVVLTEQQALDALRQLGMTETASIAALGRKWGWKRERTSKALTRWKAAGHIEREASANGKIIVRVPAVAHADAPDDGPAGNPGGLGPDDHVPGDVPAAYPGGTAPDHIPLTGEEPVGLTDVPGDVPAGNSGVPAITARLTWWILSPPALRPTVPAICRWAFGGVSVALSLSLYIASMTLDVMFWSGLAATGTGKEILGATGVIIGMTNYAVPSAISFAPSGRSEQKRAAPTSNIGDQPMSGTDSRMRGRR